MTTSEELIHSVNVYIGGQRGCCGAGTIARITGTPSTRSQRESARNDWYNNSAAVLALVKPRSNWKEDTITQCMKRNARMPLSSDSTYQRGSAVNHWRGGDVTLDVAFGSILEQLKASKYALYFMSDNVDGEGDVHLGPCNTRDFTKWLVTHQLGTIMTAGAVVSLRTGKRIQGWIFHPDWTAVNQMVAKQRASYIAMIEEMNSDPRLKERTEGRFAAQAREREEFNTGLITGWG